jgi:UDP-2,3-diacylglucosamine pyrophosphatase LpxH
MKRKVELVVISDVHLGTYGCHARELLTYLKSIHPEILVLNGDIVDIWQFRKRYFPVEHLRVINKLLRMSFNGTNIYYLTGNHDDALRKFCDMSIGNIHLQDSLLLTLNEKKTWLFHGDVFDASMRARWLAKMGGRSYDMLLKVNRIVNHLLERFGRPRVSFSKAIKAKVKSAVSMVSNFESIAIDHAIEQGFDTVVCGHIHKPQMREVKGVLYLNSGDWLENLTALEYDNATWRIFQYNDEDFPLVATMPTAAVTVADDELDDDTDLHLSKDPADIIAKILRDNKEK